MIKIQLVDDEVHILNALKRLLRNTEWEVHTFSDVQEALTALTEHEYAVIVSDYKMPHVNGVTYLQFVRQRQPHAIRMVLSAYGDRQSMIQAINQAEVYRFLSKPWEDYEVTAAIRAAVDLFLLHKEKQRLLDQLKSQQDVLDRQQQELQRLEEKFPGITQVQRDSDGSIIISDEVEDEH